MENNNIIDKTKAFFSNLFAEHGRTDAEKEKLAQIVFKEEDDTATWANGIWENPEQFIGGANVIAVLGKPDGAAPVQVVKRWGKLGNRHGIGAHTRFVQLSLLPGSEQTTWGTVDPENGDVIEKNMYVEDGQAIHFKFFESEFDKTGGNFDGLYDLMEELCVGKVELEDGRVVNKYLSTRLVMLLQTRDLEEVADEERKDTFGLSVVVTAAVIIELPNSRAGDPSDFFKKRGILRSTPAPKQLKTPQDVLDNLKASIDVAADNMGMDEPAF